MKSDLKIKWTFEATNNLENVINYLEKHWTNRERQIFFHKFEKQVTLITILPEAYSRSPKTKNVRRCVFT